MRIYTKTGDDGTTAIQGGRRLSKSDPRIMAYGAVDELNSILGVILSHKNYVDVEKLLSRLQNELFIAGSDLSNPDLSIQTNRVTDQMIRSLELDIDTFEQELPPLSNFILPGGIHTASLFHLARSVARRTEAQIVMLSNVEEINTKCIVYFNRLSDLFFVLARLINRRSQVPDKVWKP